jgi:hypothetical protein
MLGDIYTKCLIYMNQHRAEGKRNLSINRKFRMPAEKITKNNTSHHLRYPIFYSKYELDKFSNILIDVNVQGKKKSKSYDKKSMIRNSLDLLNTNIKHMYSVAGSILIFPKGKHHYLPKGQTPLFALWANRAIAEGAWG